MYIPWDFHHYAKQRNANILADLEPIIKTCLDNTSFFSYPAPTPVRHIPAPPVSVLSSLFLGILSGRGQDF